VVKQGVVAPDPSQLVATLSSLTDWAGTIRLPENF
jgi:hypothetical protein